MKYPAWANYLVAYKGQYYLLSDMKPPYFFQSVEARGGVFINTIGLRISSTGGAIGRNSKIIQYLGEEENE